MLTRCSQGAHKVLATGARKLPTWKKRNAFGANLRGSLPKLGKKRSVLAQACNILAQGCPNFEQTRNKFGTSWKQFGANLRSSLLGQGSLKRRQVDEGPCSDLRVDLARSLRHLHSFLSELFTQLGDVFLFLLAGQHVLQIARSCFLCLLFWCWSCILRVTTCPVDLHQRSRLSTHLGDFIWHGVFMRSFGGAFVNVTTANSFECKKSPQDENESSWRGCGEAQVDGSPQLRM